MVKVTIRTLYGGEQGSLGKEVVCVFARSEAGLHYNYVVTDISAIAVSFGISSILERWGRTRR